MYSATYTSTRLVRFMANDCICNFNVFKMKNVIFRTNHETHVVVAVTAVCSRRHRCSVKHTDGGTITIEWKQQIVKHKQQNCRKTNSTLLVCMCDVCGCVMLGIVHLLVFGSHHLSKRNPFIIQSICHDYQFTHSALDIPIRAQIHHILPIRFDTIAHRFITTRGSRNGTRVRRQMCETVWIVVARRTLECVMMRQCALW